MRYGCIGGSARIESSMQVPPTPLAISDASCRIGWTSGRKRHACTLKASNVDVLQKRYIAIRHMDQPPAKTYLYAGLRCNR